jgi:tRNA dimethylallyltransferase
MDFVDCWFLTGPTAAGKTAVGLELAKRLGGEIVSLDSMAVFVGMDIGTAKPSADERRRVPHHLVDLRSPAEEFSVADYLLEAQRVVARLRTVGRTPLFVGGTPLYLKALLRGLFDGPPADWALRHELAHEAQRVGSQGLHEQLAQVDPQAAAKLHPRDARRIIRALEVFRLTGRPISELQQEFSRARPADECRVFVLDWPREELYRRIDQRVRQMFDAGFVDEVSRLLAMPGLGRTARQALGYRETIEMLAGLRDRQHTIDLIATRTRHFARRQLTWFRSLSECRWVAVDAGDTADQIAERVLTLAGHR